jgi:hypothetical protein
VLEHPKKHNINANVNYEKWLVWLHEPKLFLKKKTAKCSQPIVLKT